MLNTPVLDGHFVEEAILSRRADAEVATVVTLRSLSKHMGR